ncbi:MAG: DUF4982 domain-containing protein [Oscillospiraceae bacterium]|nr:DUF4982 domain-containing protein [Oscillospiraceae bacterium]
MKELRKTMDFNPDWLYSMQDCGASAADFDDGGFAQVTLPHANRILSKHVGDDFKGQIDSYRFVSWYRKHFNIDELGASRFIIEFEGVATVADVYVNGAHIGTHKGAYTGFSFDITEALRPGENVIAVRVDSTKHTDIPPEGYEVDYCLFGGIVRNVRLHVLNPAHIADAFFSYTESGRVKALARLSGEGSLHLEVLDSEGRTVAEADGENELLTGEIEKPRLWDVDDPYLYTAVMTLSAGGAAVDRIERKIGLRHFEFKPDGFILNGRRLKLRGVNRHEQWPWLGRAAVDRLQIKDAEMIKNAGFNAVRCSHYPQSPAFLSRCDELGLIVFEEAPGWQHIGGGAWREIYKENLREMIIRDRSHPSIFTWGVRVNESNDCNELYTETAALAKELDPTRPTHGVRRLELYETSEPIEDIFCVNYTYPEVPRMLPYIVTEHSMDWFEGHGCAWASDCDAQKFTDSIASAMDYYYGNDLCTGGFLWSMFDYNNEVNYTKTGNVFYSGIYDLFRLPKPAAWFCMAQKEPESGVVLYIDNSWSGECKRVRVYSNCEEIELFVNGASRGRIRPNLYTNVPHPIFDFGEVDFADGELTAIGYIGGAEAARTVRSTPGPAARLTITPDSGVIADGADFAAVTVELTDESGTRLPFDRREIRISVSGAGEFIGESPVSLEGGRIGFIVKPHKGGGEIVLRAEADDLPAAECQITVR